METICISLGGSILIGSEGLNSSYIEKFLDTIASYKKFNFIIVTGGGEMARKYISFAKTFTSNKQELDDIAIAVTRLNAMVLLQAAKRRLDVNPNIITTISDMKVANSQHRVAISGGLYPGITTDAVAVLYAEAVQARKLINISNVSYVHETSDIKNSKPIKKMGYDKLIEIATKYDSRNPGSNFVFDLVGCELARRSGIEIYFTNTEISELRKILDGKPHNGTVVGTE
jgi:uridylate kinase